MQLGAHFTLPQPRTNALKGTTMYGAATYWTKLPFYLTVINNKASEIT